MSFGFPEVHDFCQICDSVSNWGRDMLIDNKLGHSPHK